MASMSSSNSANAAEAQQLTAQARSTCFAFIEFHQRAFQALRGIPHQIVYDHTKLSVLSDEQSPCRGFSTFGFCLNIILI
jgi:transposase